MATSLLRRHPRRLAASLFLVPMLVLALSAAQASAQQPPAGPPARAAEADTDALLQAADAIAAEVAVIRGLGLQVPIQKGLKQRDELRAVLVQKLAEEVSDADIEAEGKVFKRLGLIPASTDYKTMLLDVLTEQIAGFYDQKAKELYIMEGIPLALQRPAMAHEIFHAIQDQHFDITRLQQPFTTTENGDFALARSALIEGDATVVMFDFSLYEAGTLPQAGVTSVVDVPMIANLLERVSFDDLTALESMLGGQSGGLGPTDIGDSALGAAPAIFRELLMFPYFAGMRFVVMARSGRAWSDVDAIYADAPVSTEQILHPERYFARDWPVHLDFDAGPALPGWDRIYDSVLGEFQTLLFLKQHLAGSSTGIDPIRAAEGWDGDRLIAYEKGDGVVVAHLTAWDSVEEAQEYYDAVRATVDVRYPDARPRLATGDTGESTCYSTADSAALARAGSAGARPERIYVERWGDLVLYVEGTPSKAGPRAQETDMTTYQVREAIWKTFDRVPFQEHMARRSARR